MHMNYNIYKFCRSFRRAGACSRHIFLTQKRGNPTCGFPSFSFAEIHPFGRYLTVGSFAICGWRQGASRPLTGGRFLKKATPKTLKKRHQKLLKIRVLLKAFYSSSSSVVSSISTSSTISSSSEARSLSLSRLSSRRSRVSSI